MPKTSIAQKIFENVSFSKCDLLSLPNQHFRKQHNLSDLSLSPKKSHWCIWKYLFTWDRRIPKTSIVETFLKMCRSQTVTFDLFQTGSLKNKRIWVIWTVKKKTSVMWMKVHAYLKLPFQSIFLKMCRS